MDLSNCKDRNQQVNNIEDEKNINNNYFGN